MPYLVTRCRFEEGIGRKRNDRNVTLLGCSLTRTNKFGGLKPSITGICKSINTKSNSDSSALLYLFSPLSARSPVCPSVAIFASLQIGSFIIFTTNTRMPCKPVWSWAIRWKLCSDSGLFQSRAPPKTPTPFQSHFLLVFRPCKCTKE